MYIAALAPDHAPQTAQLHMAGQPDTFLTSLGPEVLTALYRVLPNTQDGFGCVALADPPASTCQNNTVQPSVLGFVSATTSISSLFVEMGTRRLNDLIPPLAARLMQRPDLLWRTVQTLIYPFLVREQPAPGSAQPDQGETHRGEVMTAELLSIMVRPQHRSRGIGAQLLHALLTIASQRGIDAIHVTVDAQNTGAQRFYLRHGFAQARTFRLYGRTMCLYQRSLP